MAKRLSDLKEEQVLEPTNALLEYLKKTKSSADLFDVPSKILLTVTFKLIPIVKNKVVKIQVPNGLKFDTQDVCLFVKDLKRGERDYEPSKVHFQELLQSKGIECIREIIPLKSLKLEYRPFEAKKNLLNKHDLFLADDRIFGNLPRTLGRDFVKRKRIPIQVNMNAKDLKKEFEKAVNNAHMVVTGKGSCSMAHVANSNMTAEQIAANILKTATVLGEVIPGGAENIRNIYIKTEDSPSLPVYISKAGCDTVRLPAAGKVKETPEPEEIDWSLRSKAFVTENNDIFLSSKDGAKKLLWGGSDFSNLPEKKRILLRKKIRSFKKGSKISTPGVKGNDKGKKGPKGKKPKGQKKTAENGTEPKQNGGLKEKPKKNKKKSKNVVAVGDKPKKEKKASPKAEKIVKKKKIKEKLSELKTGKKSVKTLKMKS